MKRKLLQLKGAALWLAPVAMLLIAAVAKWKPVH